MIGEFLVWLLQWYYICIALWNSMFQVLKIKYKTAKIERKVSEEAKGHLALRLNDFKAASSMELLELVIFVHQVFGVKFLTLIAGRQGFEREFDIRKHEINDIKIRIYSNFELIHGMEAATVSVNLIDNDSESLFLLKLKDSIETNDSAEKIYKTTLKSFTSMKTGVLLFMFSHNLFLFKTFLQLTCSSVWRDS